MSVNKQCLEQNIRRLPEEFSVQEFCDSFRDNYPAEFAKWGQFHIKKGAADEQNAVHSTIYSNPRGPTKFRAPSASLGISASGSDAA
jgi:hypothetical protein